MIVRALHEFDELLKTFRLGQAAPKQTKISHKLWRLPEHVQTFVAGLSFGAFLADCIVDVCHVTVGLETQGMSHASCPALVEHHWAISSEDCLARAKGPLSTLIFVCLRESLNMHGQT